MPFPLIALPATGRRYTSTRQVRLGDVAPSGRLRLDAIARYLQDVAGDDAADAMGDAAFGWVVRRTTIEVVTFPELGEQLDLTTWGSGIGSRWAERRTLLVRRSDLDVLGHVNNAVYLAMVEEAFGIDGQLELPFRAEVEYRGGLDQGIAVSVLVEGGRLWIKAGDDVVATALIGYPDPAEI